ncbi:hypothetical protein [Microscilla marina]|uniref:Uncharacterized protein n=1 Tax=Microscilla marina ATCC 23134 TaxID=313606 RepID=A1ZT58_MICM2|nr:hypothetical protein [Microscilla marina]EAY26448.1 hypothetical protein M23134_07043 [Microscilla marina ATCC 23134]
MLNESLLQNFPPANDKDVFDIIQFIKKSPLEKNYWRILKTLYKKTETYFLGLSSQDRHAIDVESTNNQLLMLTHLIFKIDRINPQDVKSPYPTHATLRYMKRRARRFLRTLAVQQPQYYFQIASKLLVFQADKPPFNLSYQWISADILLGNSRRAHQKGHGQGKFVFDGNRYHLHRREDGQPEVWDGHLNFLQELLMKNLPWEIYEFAVKILDHHQATPTQVSEEVLEKFFSAPSHWLKRTATAMAYQTFLFQGVKPALFAGMWLYSNATIRKKIDETDANRPNKGAKWYKDYGKHLFKYSFNELRVGNNGKRIVKALELVQQKYAQEIQPDSILPIAPALLQSKHKALNDLALQGADFAQEGDAMEWLKALGTNANEQLYKQLAKKLITKFTQRYMYARDIEPYVYNVSPYIADFGWRLSDKLSWGIYSVWSKLTDYQHNNRIKRAYFINAITTQAGINAFMNYYSGRHYLNSLPEYILNDIISDGDKRVYDFLVNRLKLDLIKQPMYHLQRLAVFPGDVKEGILAEALQKLKNKDLFKDSWGVNNGFSNIYGNDWAIDAFFQLLDIAKVSDAGASNLCGHVFKYDQLAERLMAYIYGLPNSSNRKSLFLKHLADKLSRDVNLGSRIPAELISEVMLRMNFEMLLTLVATANDQAWENLSKAVYQQLLHKQNEVGFWKNILERVLSAESQVLSNRLIEDQGFFELFQQQKDASVLEINHPSFEQALLAWVKNNEDLFTAGAAPLRSLCYHKLPSLRQWGLAKATEMGMSIMFGLQLLESGIPDTMAAGRAYFNGLAAGSDDEREAALALCDSPSKEVRTFGMEFLTQRKDQLKDQPQVLAFLSEHADAFVQAFVSHEISQQALNEPFVARFDKEILRMKNRSRKAKEHTKKRVEETMAVDAQVLKEVARSGGKTDAEWAIVQLTKKALAGEEIDGFVLD